MQQEVNALRALDGRGTPLVFETNAEVWQQKGLPLYVIMEWVEGITLAQYVARSPVNLEVALLVVRALIEIVDACHRVETFHRDLKPDNIVLKGGKVESPILVDFGMAWTKPVEDQDLNFDTPSGQELGNRFCRLPEYAPGRHLRDARSDLTMVVGLLFFMLTGRAPRILTDADGKLPHEALSVAVPQELRDDPRWQRLRSIFTVGFQDRLDLRFQSAAHLRKALEDLNQSAPPADGLGTEVAKLQELLESEIGRDASRVKEQLEKTTQTFVNSFQSHVSQAGLSAGGSWGLTEAGRVSMLTWFIQRPGVSEPMASFQHQIRSIGSEIYATYQIEGSPSRHEYYRGHSADTEALERAVKDQAGRILALLLPVFREKLALVLHK